ncbi:hypothetical protein ACQP0C_41645 (plasmid) [Nocardia sp. CA-129566]|uniref:hypothetical protein n=1 Tax=Nocardia sp. CA-129566 TaxID=3239976 RepID=UPI003D99C65F
MATAIIEMDDVLFTRIQQAAGENFSEWVSKACRSRLLADAARDAAVWEHTHPAEAAQERAEESARSLESEAEHEIQYQAEEAARRRGGDQTEPTAEEIAEAEQRVRALFERADRRLREHGEGD